MSMPLHECEKETDPRCEKQDLFTARTEGYYHTRIPGLCVTPGGVVLAYGEARQGRGGDWDPIDIRMRRSLDGGQSWMPAQTVVGHQAYGGSCINNFITIPDAECSLVHALYCYDYGRAFHMTSSDEGASWSAPVEITATFEGFRAAYDWTVLAIGPGHGLALRSGRLLAPVWLSNCPTRKQHQPNRVGAIYSDDHGRTWQAGQLVEDTFANSNESEAIELLDGRVMLNFRNMTPAFRRGVAISSDGGANWGAPRLDTALVDTVCFAGFCRYSGLGDGQPSRILFSHPVSENPVVKPVCPDRRMRENLVVRMSEDEGATWTNARVLEPGPAGYSDLCVTPDGAILCLYECGMIEHMYDSASLTLARFNLAWLRDGG